MRHPVAVCLFAAAMGLLEGVVVVYLRRIFYPDGFHFPIVPIDPSLYHAEVVREAMTLIMLLTVAWIAAPSAWPRFMALLVVWGIWDIAYYVGLFVFLGWPRSLLTDDLLFLIPVYWVSPVLAPVLISATWVIAGLRLHRVPVERIRPRSWEWTAATLGSLVILASFLIPRGTPEEPGFLWGVFIVGFALGAGVLVRFWMRAQRGGAAPDMERGVSPEGNPS